MGVILPENKPANSVSPFVDEPETVYDASTKASNPDRILLVEDDSTLRHLVYKGLKNADYQVTCAIDGEEGWRVLCAFTFDLLITDHEMPKMTGLNLLRRIRTQALRVPVILMSGSMPWSEADLLRVLQPGIAMEKPFPIDVLVANVRALLNPGHASEQAI